MLYHIQGELTHRGDSFLVIRTGGVSFRIGVNRRTLERLPQGSTPGFYCHLRVVEGGSPELYGFLTEAELSFFEQLLSVSGVGPKSALSILDVADLSQLLAAIKESRPDLLSRASGIGVKTASRIILELKNKVRVEGAEHSLKRMETDVDLVETLTTLGYTRDQAERALERVPRETKELEVRLKEALRYLKEK